MGLFRKKRAKNGLIDAADSAALAQRSLDFIAEGVLLVDERGMIRFANPAAAAMTGHDTPESITGLDYQLVIRLETSEEVPVEAAQNQLAIALSANQAMTTRQYLLVSAQSEHRIAVALSCIPTGGVHNDRIITFRDITRELAEEREQAEFISTASHEMRTPVASIEGYLGLALNPQTATIDARARQYLESAHAASQHLGHLFKDLLDVTRLDDSRERINLVPVDAVAAVQYIANERMKSMEEKHLKRSFGGAAPALDKKRIAPKIFMAVDYDFLHEIVDNLVENAIKYTPDGGEVRVNVQGDGDKVVISVKDTGIGIAPEDLGHVFQKFYRVDNSQTRQIGGTGLGLYLVKQRVEALGGRVWVESQFGKGSTFYVSLPRISESEYERMRIAQANAQMVHQFSAPESASAPRQVNSTVSTNSATSADEAAALAAIQAANAPRVNVVTGTAGVQTHTDAPAPAVSSSAAAPAIGAAPNNASVEQHVGVAPNVTSATPDQANQK